MKKKISFFKIFIYLLAIGVFSWYEYNLYKKYSQEEKIREELVAKKTVEIENSFLIRKKGFYSDREYIKKFEDIKQQEKEEEDSLNGGESIIEQTAGI
ncbi:hypothetical protein [Fusobacterium sp.]|uniref:hypothetical protein n=1 Tax=Fusobacterium sp. TaxID=68766 RepID=UPI00396C803F